MKKGQGFRTDIWGTPEEKAKYEAEHAAQAEACRARREAWLAKNRGDAKALKKAQAKRVHEERLRSAKAMFKRRSKLLWQICRLQAGLSNTLKRKSLHTKDAHAIFESEKLATYPDASPILTDSTTHCSTQPDSLSF